MSFKVDWSIESAPVCLDAASKITGASHEYIREMFRTGSFGPAQNVSTQAKTIPIYQLIALCVLIEGQRKKITIDQIWAALPAIAGAAYIKFLVNEITAGRCDPRGGTPNLNYQLFSMLKSPEGPSMLEGKIPGGQLKTYRYAWFNHAGYFTADDLSAIEGSSQSCEIIDAWAITSQMTKGVRGMLVATHIA